MTRDRFRPAAHPTDHFLLATVVGSYPQPAWLDAVRGLDQETFGADALAEAHDDACRATIGQHERAGLDVVSDGEMRREGMVDYFAGFIDGYEPGGDGDDWNARMPTVVGPVDADGPWVVPDYEFAADVADRPVKTTLTGPFTLASFCTLEAYDSVPELAYDVADLVGEEVARLADAGATYVQLDEPALGMSPHVDVARECLDRIAPNAPADLRLGLHVCSGNYGTLLPALLSFPVDEVDLEFASDGADPVDVLAGHDLGVDVGVGVVDTTSKAVDPVETIEGRIRDALAAVPPDRLTLTPDCGMKPLPRDVAVRKMTNLAAAARAVEAELDAGRVDPLAA